MIELAPARSVYLARWASAVSRAQTPELPYQVVVCSDVRLDTHQVGLVVTSQRYCWTTCRAFKQLGFIPELARGYLLPQGLDVRHLRLPSTVRIHDRSRSFGGGLGLRDIFRGGSRAEDV